MNTRKTRAKRVKLTSDEFVSDFEEASVSSMADPDELDALRKSRIRDSNKEFARRMTILQAWSEYWSDYQTREGDAYPLQEAKSIIKRAKKITCPIQTCRKPFTTIGGLRYHYARCNVERTIRCLVCKPPLKVTTRGELLKHMILSHCQELPALNAEQQEIASSYFSCESRIDKREKREKRINIETESQCTSQDHVKNYYALFLRNSHQDWCQERPFLRWLAQSKDWELISHVVERRRFYPPEIDSVRVKLPTLGIDGCTSLKTGESANIELDKRNQPTSILFYTGGINTAITWRPKSLQDPTSQYSPELLTVAVNCCSMEQSYTFRESHHNEGCIQFWTMENGHIKTYSISMNLTTNTNDSIHGIEPKPFDLSLSYMIGHTYGTIFDMVWCPFGISWLSKESNNDLEYSREGLLALACGDGQVRILCVPDTQYLLSKGQRKISESTIDSTQMFKVKPVANLMPPGVGPSSDYQGMSCKSICWSTDSGQKLIAAGYVNGMIAIYDLANLSPILYVQSDNMNTYQPLKSWFAHGGPVTSLAFSPFQDERVFIASGSVDRHLRICNPVDLNAVIVSDRAPINKICWDFRYRGVIAATDQAFTSFNNKVSYRYPSPDGSNHSVTVSTHRASVYGLANNILTSSIATSDQAGEVFILPQLMNRSSMKRDKNMLSVHSLYSMVPFSFNDNNDTQQTTSLQNNKDNNQDDGGAEEDGLNEDADFSGVERPIANIPNKFLLPIEHRPIATYEQFKQNFGLEFHHYNSIPTKTTDKMPDSCIRAMDIKDIYCDRPCDYPFASINQVAWSPNPGTFPYLLSATQVGFCRLDRVQIIEQIFKSHIEHLKPKMDYKPTNIVMNDEIIVAAPPPKP